MATPQKKKPSGIRFNIWMMYLCIGAALFATYFFDNNSLTKEINYTEFEQIVVMHQGIKNITVQTDKKKAEGELTDEYAKKLFKNELKNVQTMPECKVVTDIPSNDKFSDRIDEWRSAGLFTGDVKYEQAGTWSNIFWVFGPIVLLVVLWMFILRKIGGGGSGIFSVGKSKAMLFDRENATKVTFNDVAGLSEAKTEVEEIVDFLKNPDRYTNLGGKIPKGALLVGPPGTGKTLLAKAVAGEANVPFFSLSGSDFVEMFVGVGASRVRDLFRQAKEKAPCIVFIDEIDAVGRARGRNSISSNDERESTLNQLLTEMDGFGTNSGIIILAATNRAEILDKALLRAGRFDRQIYVDLPEISDRVEIFKVHLRDVKCEPNLDIDQLARQTPGFSGADIANACNEAALIAARNNRDCVRTSDFHAAIDRIIGGLEKRSQITTAEEKRAIAVHEAGHATISWHLQYASPLVKVTIVPRGKALGAAWYAPEERKIVPRQALCDELCSLLGGRAAEELFTGTVSTGAANDLERVTKQAYAMVAYYGMSDRIPNVSYYDSTGQEYQFAKPFSDERARIIDEEVSRIIAEQYDRAKQILTEHADGHNRLADLLVSREVIFTDDVVKIFGPRQWKSRSDELLEANTAQSAAADGAKPAAQPTTDSKPAADAAQPAADAAASGSDEPTPPPFPGTSDQK